MRAGVVMNKKKLCPNFREEGLLLRRRSGRKWACGSCIPM